MSKRFVIKGHREQRGNDIAQMILTLMIWTLIFSLVLIFIVHDDTFAITTGIVMITYAIWLLYRFNFVKLGQFIVDYEYSVNNLYEIEGQSIIEFQNEYKVLKQMNIFHDIGFDSPVLMDIKSDNHIKLQAEWNRIPHDRIPEWNGLTVISRNAVKMVLNRMN